MSGLHARAFGHLLRRGVSTISSLPVGGSRDAYVAELEMKAKAYDESPFKDIKLWEVAIIFLTGAIFMIIYASLKYTLGEVVASLAMIEQPRKLAVSDSRPAKESDDADAPLKERLLDEDVALVQEKPITASIPATIRHLAQVGGHTARWRGLVISTVYHMLQAVLAHLISVPLAMIHIFAPFAFITSSILSTVLLARIHMTWTHIMISSPSPLPWYRRIPRGTTYFRALLTPAFIFAVAQHLTVILPLMVYYAFPTTTPKSPSNATPEEAKCELLRLLATLATAAFVALALLLPASVTLTRVEASLLPDEDETIVPFDRTLGGAAANLVGFGKINFRALYDAAWRSFDKQSRIRLVKFYVKYFGIMAALWVVFVAVVAAEVAVLGGERWVGVMHGLSAKMHNA